MQSSMPHGAIREKPDIEVNHATTFVIPLTQPRCVLLCTPDGFCCLTLYNPNIARPLVSAGFRAASPIDNTAALIVMNPLTINTFIPTINRTSFNIEILQLSTQGFNADCRGVRGATNRHKLLLICY